MQPVNITGGMRRTGGGLGTERDSAQEGAHMATAPAAEADDTLDAALGGLTAEIRRTRQLTADLSALAAAVTCDPSPLLPHWAGPHRRTA